jgi:hypothetical protein
MVAAALGCSLAALSAWPAGAWAQACQLCTPEQAAAAKKPNARPITIQVETSMDFAKIGLVTAGQGGTVELDEATGTRTFTGNLVDLGGLVLTGTVLIRGEPNEHVTVTMPASVGLSNNGGQSYPLSNLTTTLKNNPKLDKEGILRFNFGGLLRIDGSATGTFRGSVPITIEYK